MLKALLISLVALLALTRLLELRVSRRHRRWLFERGARAVSDPGFLAMVCLHTAVLAGALLEPLFTKPAVPAWFSLMCALGVLAANGLRLSAIRSLGQHWNVRVVDSTALGVVDSGPYRFVRHPNYVAVFLELLFLPLMLGAWCTAALGSALHLLVLRRRILLEEQVLLAHPAYRATMAAKPRFVPRAFQLVPALARSDKS